MPAVLQVPAIRVEQHGGIKTKKANRPYIAAKCPRGLQLARRATTACTFAA